MDQANSKPSRASRRIRERELLSLPVTVHCTAKEYEWVEVSDIIDASPFGARLGLTRPLGPGRLLKLNLNMPVHLRCFDHEKPEYCTWAIVRHLQQRPDAGPNGKQFEIGVAFIGKHAPVLNETEFAVEFDITAGPSATSLWSVSPHNLDAPPVHEGERRRDPRLPIITDVIVEVYDAEGRVFASEQVKTENLSRRGMAVVSELDLVRGRYVRLRNSEYNIAVIAAVRRVRRSADGRQHLHLEFVDQNWPQLE